jgi:hypothetical protein
MGLASVLGQGVLVVLFQNSFFFFFERFCWGTEIESFQNGVFVMVRATKAQSAGGTSTSAWKVRSSCKKTCRDE